MAAPISYSLANGSLTCNGPPIDAQGRLMENSAAESTLVVRGVTAFEVSTRNPRTPAYRISVRDSNGVIYTSGTADGAQCRVRSFMG